MDSMTDFGIKRKFNHLSDNSDFTQITRPSDLLTDSQKSSVERCLQFIIASIDSNDGESDVKHIQNNESNSCVIQCQNNGNKGLNISDLDLNEEFWEELDLDLTQTNATFGNNNLLADRQVSDPITNSVEDRVETNGSNDVKIDSTSVDFRQHFQQLLNKMNENIPKIDSIGRTDVSSDALKVMSELDSINDSLIDLNKKMRKTIQTIK